MKIALASDVHLEFGTISFTNDENADVLVLSGDICTEADLGERDFYNLMGEHTRNAQYHTFFQECSARFPTVIYIAGNHEHYNGDYGKTIAGLKSKLAYLKNLHVLDREFIEVGDTMFFGGTLWTDMNKEDPNTLYGIRKRMNDFRIVKDSSQMVSYKAFIPKDKPVGMTDEDWFKVPYEERHTTEFKERVGSLLPETVVEEHKSYLKILGEAIESRPEMKWIVCGHHSPSKQSTKPQYESDWLMNGGYSSDLSEFILDRPQIKLWTHGHTHHNFDYLIGSTRIACNPRGYINYEHQADVFELQYFTV
jgi:Icc-related predicted phosphoesterase